MWSGWRTGPASCVTITIVVNTIIVITPRGGCARHVSPSAPPDPDALPFRPLPGPHLGAAGRGTQPAGPARPGPRHIRRTLGLRRDRRGPDPAAAPGVPARLDRTRLR